MSISFYFYENQSNFYNVIEKLKSDFIKKFLLAENSQQILKITQQIIIYLASFPIEVRRSVSQHIRRCNLTGTSKHFSLEYASFENRHDSLEKKSFPIL